MTHLTPEVVDYIQGDSRFCGEPFTSFRVYYASWGACCAEDGNCAITPEQECPPTSFWYGATSCDVCTSPTAPVTWGKVKSIHVR